MSSTGTPLSAEDRKKLDKALSVAARRAYPIKGFIEVHLREASDYAVLFNLDNIAEVSEAETYMGNENEHHASLLLIRTTESNPFETEEDYATVRAMIADATK